MFSASPISLTVAKTPSSSIRCQRQARASALTSVPSGCGFEELVDRAKAVAQVFRLARDERDAWVNWPARVAAMMAAELEVDPHKLHTVVERHVRDHLAELAEVRPNLR
jgi:hypothetical protein